MHKSGTKCNKTIGKWCKNKHGASKIIDTLETYQGAGVNERDLPCAPIYTPRAADRGCSKNGPLTGQLRRCITTWRNVVGQRFK
jgi:hypothetical protein